MATTKTDTTSKEAGTIYEQLLAVQMEIDTAKKDSKNPFFKTTYSDLNSVMAVAKPALNNNMLFVMHTIRLIEGRSFVVTIVYNTKGESVECPVEILLKEQSNPQALGSAITYARRYGLSALLAIEQEDDDGEGAVGKRIDTVGQAKKLVAKPTGESFVSHGNYAEADPLTGEVYDDVDFSEKKAKVVNGVVYDAQGNTEDEYGDKYVGICSVCGSPTKNVKLPDGREFIGCVNFRNHKK